LENGLGLVMVENDSKDGITEQNKCEDN